MQAQTSEKVEEREKEKKKKRKHRASPPTAINRKYQSLLAADFVEQSSALVIVERPWLHVLASLPAPLATHRYGT